MARPRKFAGRIAKWRDNLAVRLPESVVNELRLKEGDEIEVHIAPESNVPIDNEPVRLALLRDLRKFRGRLPAGFRLDRREVNERR